jgi:hypothetical protein
VRRKTAQPSPRSADAPAAINVAPGLLRDGFVQVPVALLRLPAVASGAKLLYAVILHLHYRLGFWPGRRAVAHEMRVGERSVVTYLAELEAAGTIGVNRTSRGYILSIDVPDPSAWLRVQDLHPKRSRAQKPTSREQTSHPPVNKETSINTKGLALGNLAKSLLGKGRAPDAVMAVLTQYGTTHEEAREIVEAAKTDALSVVAPEE